ncbi:MAG: ISL3 family transposase, partial [Bacteroidota bacterium]
KMTTISVPINLPDVEVINTNILENGDIILRVKSGSFTFSVADKIFKKQYNITIIHLPGADKMTTISVSINLSDVEVINTNILDNGDIIVRVKSTKTGTCCKHCGEHTARYHSLNEKVILNHLPSFGNAVYIEFKPVRYMCTNCDGNPTTTEKPSWYQSKGHCTELYAKYILDLLINSTIKDVARRENITYKRIISIIKNYIPTGIDWSKIKELKILGIDEISIKKGHKDFVVIISTKINGNPVVLGILKNRKKDTLKKFLLSIPSHLAKTVESVCCDMYDGFIYAVKEVSGSKVRVVIDRFHVSKNYRKSIENLRKKEMKRLKSELSEEEYAKLTNIMWILRKNPQTISDEEKEKLNLLFKYSPLLKKAYNFMNKLTSIFNQDISVKQAKRKINQWIKNVEKSALTCFNTFIKTLKKLWNEILNYFVNRFNSGFVEGLNNKIKVLKRRCYGIFNVENLFQRVSIDLEGNRSIH